MCVGIFNIGNTMHIMSCKVMPCQYVCMYVCMYMCVYVCMYAGMYVYVFVYVYVRYVGPILHFRLSLR
jgi:hypothetical protein